jgi:hypothetical protein
LAGSLAFASPGLFIFTFCVENLSSILFSSRLDGIVEGDPAAKNYGISKNTLCPAPQGGALSLRSNLIF